MRPSRLTLGITVLLLIGGITQEFLSILSSIWFLPALILALPCFIDALILVFRTPPTMERQVAPIMTAGKALKVTLVFQPGFATALFKEAWCSIHDGIPAQFNAPTLPLRFRLSTDQCQNGFSLDYDVTAPKRGNFTFVPAWVEVSSYLGFWWRRHRLGTAENIRVYPDYQSLLGAFHLGGAVDQSSGLHHFRRRGLGLEFHQLREYQQGDMIRMVDPKASSRYRKLIVREMQEEEDQSVLFLLDTGYRMTAAEDGKSHFDQAFEAMLSLAWVALKQGDRVGVRAWGPQERWVPPRRGISSFSYLVQGLYDLEAQPEASSPATILSKILPSLNRRTLIILLSNFREEDNEDMRRFIPIVQSRHLLCTVWMREAVVEELINRVPANHDQAVETMMARSYVEERRRCRSAWEDAGILTIDTVPSQLSARLVQQYWDIKTRALL